MGQENGLVNLLLNALCPASIALLVVRLVKRCYEAYLVDVASVLNIEVFNGKTE